MCNKMSSPAMLCKSIERGMRECDKFWKEKSEIQSTWEKIFTLYCEPKDIFGQRIYEYACFMKFRYFEDYKKMKKLNIMLGKLFIIIGNERYIDEMKKKIKNISNLLEEANFLNVDFDDGLCFRYKFSNIKNYINDLDELKYKDLRKHFIFSDEEKYYELTEIMSSLLKIRNESLKRGIKKFD